MPLAVKSKTALFANDTYLYKVNSLLDTFALQNDINQLTKWEKLWSNQPATTASEYYKRSLTIPLLDQLLNDLESRFSENSLTSYYGLYLLPSKIVSMEHVKRKMGSHGNP